jgi:hypothetical protein
VRTPIGGAGDVDCDSLDAAQQLLSRSLAVGADCELQLDFRRDDVVPGAAMNGSDGHHARLHRTLTVAEHADQTGAADSGRATMGGVD